MKIFKNKGLVPFILVLSACTPPADTAPKVQDEPDPIKARQDLMHRWGKANNNIKAMTKDPANFNIANLQSHINIIDISQEQMWAYFDDNALAIPNSKVNRLIKDNPNDYHAHIESFTTAFNELKDTTHRTPHFDKLKPLIDKVNQECKACHKKYKKRT